MSDLSGKNIADIERRLRHMRPASENGKEAVRLAELLLTEVHRLRLQQAQADADRAAQQ